MPRWKWATLLMLGALVVGEFLQAETSTLAGVVRGLFWLLLATAGSLVFVGTVLWAIRSMGVRLRFPGRQSLNGRFARWGCAYVSWTPEPQ